MNISRATPTVEWRSDEGLYRDEGLHVTGTRVEYSCEEGFLMSPSRFTGLVCDEYGDWIVQGLDFSGTPICIRSLFALFIHLLS